MNRPDLIAAITGGVAAARSQRLAPAFRRLTRRPTTQLAKPTSIHVHDLTDDSPELRLAVLRRRLGDLHDREQRLIDRRCRCSRPAAQPVDGCIWHNVVSAEYAGELQELLLWVAEPVRSV